VNSATVIRMCAWGDHTWGKELGFLRLTAVFQAT